MSHSPVECIERAGVVYAYVVRASFAPAKTEFVTPNTLNQQLGFIVYAANTTIPRHYHLPQERRITGTSEVIIVRSGKCTAEIYDEQQQPLASVGLQRNDVIVLVAGGHGFRVEEDTVLMEVKQGPFTGRPEKERF